MEVIWKWKKTFLPFLESNVDGDLCHRVFYSQIIRFERLSSHRTDFERRTRYLGEILTSRGYNFNILERLFSKCIIKYATEFQKWYLPLNIKTWFSDIFKDQPTGLIPPGPFRLQMVLRHIAASPRNLPGAYLYYSHRQIPRFLV